MEAWYVDVSTWDLASAEWQHALRCLPGDEQKLITRFMFDKDKRLALASRLLQRQLVHEQHFVDWHDVRIARTPEGKPYWTRSWEQSGAKPTWNFNVSHHGTVVAIAAHDDYLVGVDVMDMYERPKPRRDGPVSIDEFFRAFIDYFTPIEWQYVKQNDDDEGKYYRFYRLWSLKEAYIKAIGIGLGFHLLRAEFTSSSADESEWQMKLDGHVATQWRFRSDLVGTHVISSAIGPVTDMHAPETSSILPVVVGKDQVVPSPHEFPRFDWKRKALQDLTPAGSPC